jgi:YVTN family beta-propeller protein
LSTPGIVTVIDSKTNSVTANIKVGYLPEGLGYKFIAYRRSSVISGSIAKVLLPPVMTAIFPSSS